MRPLLRRAAVAFLPLFNVLAFTGVGLLLVQIVPVWTACVGSLVGLLTFLALTADDTEPDPKRTP